jgi:hypothetical protein
MLCLVFGCQKCEYCKHARKRARAQSLQRSANSDQEAEASGTVHARDPVRKVGDILLISAFLYRHVALFALSPPVAQLQDRSCPIAISVETLGTWNSKLLSTLCHVQEVLFKQIVWMRSRAEKRNVRDSKSQRDRAADQDKTATPTESFY